MDTVNYVNIEYIIEQIQTEHIQGTYWTESEIKEWIYQALAKINTPQTKIYGSVVLEIIDGKAKIPAYINSILHVFNSDEKELHKSFASSFLEDYTYIINNGFIYVNFPIGFIVIEFYQFPVDSNNNPLIPEQDYMVSAVIAYLKFKLGERAFFSGKMLENQFRYLEQRWLFCLPSAQASSKTGIYSDFTKFKSIHNQHLL